MLDILFHCNVHSMLILHPIVNTVRKIAEAEASWLMLSNTLLFAELPDLRRPVRTSSHSRFELAKSEP